MEAFTRSIACECSGIGGQLIADLRHGLLTPDWLPTIPVAAGAIYRLYTIRPD